MGLFKKKEDVKDIDISQEQIDKLDQESQKSLYEYLNERFGVKEQVVEEPKKEEQKEVETQPEEEKKDSEVVDKTDEAIVEEQQKQVEEQPKVEEQEVQNAISLNDVVTKQDLQVQLDALNAKLESIVKENTDLKEQLSKSTSEAKDLKEKYENGDFGTERANKVEADKPKTYESYADYKAKFIK